MPEAISFCHEKILQTMAIPKWMNLNCPFCKKALPLRSIRSFSVKLNTRNLGDITVEILCTDCSKMDTLYFRQEISTIPEFIDFLNGTRQPKGAPFIEEDMYAQRYNNVVEEIAKRSL